MKIKKLPSLLPGIVLGLSALSPASAGTPVAPPPAVTQKLPPEWEFTVTPYFWAASMGGTLGLGSYSTDFFAPFSDVIQHFDIGAALSFEVRHDRWSFLFDSSYVKVSADGDPPGPLYRSAGLEFEQAWLQGAIAFRVLEGRRGWLEVFGGARWNYIGADVNLEQDSQGIADFSREVTNRAVDRGTVAAQNILDEIAASVAPVVKSKLNQAANTVRNGIISSVRDRILDIYENLPEGPGNGHPGDILPGYGAAIADKVKAYADALVAQKVAEAQAAIDATKSKLAKKAQQAVARAKNELASAINQQLRKNLPTSASRSVNWLDPIVGLRARLNLSDSFFLKLYGDVGGFGAGSDLTWQYYAGLCWQASKNGVLELGWRQNYNDYSNGNFLYKVNMYGPYIAYSYRF